MTNEDAVNLVLDKILDYKRNNPCGPSKIKLSKKLAKFFVNSAPCFGAVVLSEDGGVELICGLRVVGIGEKTECLS